MRSGIVFVPLTLPPEVADKERVQYEVDNNIGLAHHFVALLHESWGPAQRNFERDYRLAIESRDRPGRPMRTVAVGLKRTGTPHSLQFQGSIVCAPGTVQFGFH